MLGTAVVLAACGLVGWRMNVPDSLMLWSAVGILIAYYIATRKVLRKLNERSHAPY
jgi:hypothetical protein